MTALRGVGPQKVCDAGSCLSYASVSTMIPPTPSTHNVVPINRLATSVESRVKSMPVNREAPDGPAAHKQIPRRQPLRPV
jgi:hypothetical protein